MPSPKEMYQRPMNTFVARFLGNPPMNLLKGKYRKDKQSIMIQDTNVVIDLQKYRLSQVEGDSECVTIGIRPEDLVITDDDVSFTGVITSLQTLGKEIYVKIKISNKWDVTMVTSWDLDFKVGGTVESRDKRLTHLLTVGLLKVELCVNMRARITNFLKKDEWKALLLLSPALLVIIVFQIYPIIKTLAMSFYTDFDYLTGTVYKRGVDNFEYVLTDNWIFIWRLKIHCSMC